MKFELKTENENYSKSFSQVFKMIYIVGLAITLCNIAIKLGIISRHYQIEYNCKLLTVEKSKTIFNKLSSFSNLKNKQKIWEFCKEVVR